MVSGTLFTQMFSFPFTNNTNPFLFDERVGKLQHGALFTFSLFCSCSWKFYSTKESHLRLFWFLQKSSFCSWDERQVHRKLGQVVFRCRFIFRLETLYKTTPFGSMALDGTTLPVRTLSTAPPLYLIRFVQLVFTRRRWYRHVFLVPLLKSSCDILNLECGWYRIVVLVSLPCYVKSKALPITKPQHFFLGTFSLFSCTSIGLYVWCVAIFTEFSGLDLLIGRVVD